MKERKYIRGGDGQTYALYHFEDEESIYAFTHINNWIEVYNNMMVRELLPGDPFSQEEMKPSRGYSFRKE